MPCYHPLQGWRSRNSNESGKRSIVFNRSKGYADQEVIIPCGQCIGCRLERSRQWAMRCVHEASLYDQNCFITLTYAEEHLPENGTLVLADFQKFMKRLRKKFHPQLIRFYGAGEYGEESNRPHYHACVFNCDFPDKKIWKTTNDTPLYTSEILSALWPMGFATIGDVTFDSAAYVARYIMKKVLGPHAEYHYGDLLPEFSVMSRRPGIASDWFKKYKSDLYPSDFITIKGRKQKAPKFYDQLLEKEDPELWKKIKYGRKYELSKVDEEELTLRRLDTKLECKEAQIKLLPRRYDENGS